MPNMSFMLTTAQVWDGSKWVTRRVGWKNLKMGTRVQAIVKGQGLKPGEKVQRLRLFDVGEVRQEPLRRMLDDAAYGAQEVALEGFPHLPPEKFVDFFMDTHKGVMLDTLVTRIETLWLLPRPEDFRITYGYAPGRFSQRQHSYYLTECDGAAVQVSGYGATAIAAFRDLKDEVERHYRPLSGILYEVYQRSLGEGFGGDCIDVPSTGL